MARLTQCLPFPRHRRSVALGQWPYRVSGGVSEDVGMGEVVDYQPSSDPTFLEEGRINELGRKIACWPHRVGTAPIINGR